MGTRAAWLLATLQACAYCNASEIQLAGELVRFEDLQGTGEHPPGESLDISADGRLAAIERDQRLLVADLAHGKVLAELGNGNNPLWAPDGRVLVFYSTRDGTLQLWTWSVGSVSPRPLTRFADGIDADPTTRIASTVASAFRVRWSRDSRHVAFASRVALREPEAAADAPMVLDRDTPPGLAIHGVLPPIDHMSGVPESPDARSYRVRPWRPGEFHFSEIFAADIESGAVRQVTHGTDDFFSPEWSADGATIWSVHVRRPKGTPNVGAFLWDKSPEATTQIVRIDLASSSIVHSLDARGIQSNLTLSPDGQWLAYVENRSVTDPASLVAVRLADADDSWRVVGEGHDIYEYRWNHRSSSFSVLHCRATCTIKQYAVSDRGQKVADTITVDAAIDSWGADGGDRFYWIAAGQLHARATARKRPQVITALSRQTRPMALGRVIDLSWKNLRGEQLSGKLLLPPHYQRRNRYPMILDVYPLYEGGGWMSPLAGNQAWASAGYLVFRPNPRAPHVWMNTMKSEEFSRAAMGSKGWAVTIDDVISGIAQVERHGLVDTERMCLFGHSNGGGVAAFLITRTERFKCAVIVAPNAVDWLSLALLTPAGRSVYQRWAGGPPIEANPEEYVRLSPVFSLGKVTTPVLIGAGDDDSAFLLNAIELYNGLRAGSAPVTLVRYPHQGHYLRGSALRDFWNRQMEFFAKHLR